ncbi:MAG: dihydroneopterin aldolase [Pseudomonadota bacterium]
MTTDRISISNLRIHGYHGVKEAEKSLGQKFHVDIAYTIKRQPSGPDRMNETVCYGAVCDLAARVSQSETFNLIETLADRIAAAVLSEFDLVQSIEIEIRKPSAPVSHIIDHVAVAITRSRDD